MPILFEDTAGSSCGALLPTGRAVDVIDGVEATLIDNGMPCVVMRASDLGITGEEAPKDLEANDTLRKKLEAIRLKAGPLMNLGDVTEKSVPKMTMVSAPRHGGAISTRTFIPHRCHSSIGVLGAVSVATACLLKQGPAASLAETGEGARALALDRASDRRDDRRRDIGRRRHSRTRRDPAHRPQALRRGGVRRLKRAGGRMVRAAGVEPAWLFSRGILSPLRLPVSPRPLAARPTTEGRQV